MKRSMVEIATICLVLGGLGMAGVCAVGAACSPPAATAATDCHEERETIDSACCCSIGVPAERALSVPTLVSSGCVLIAESGATRGMFSIEWRDGTSERGAPPPVQGDRQAFLCVYLT